MSKRAKAKLLSVTLERFKSFEGPTTIEFAPLTIIHGPNNGGKSSIIQSLLLLKQTLADPRSEVPLKLEGLVDAFSLNEITWGRPAGDIDGPRIRLEWESTFELDGEPHRRKSIIDLRWRLRAGDVVLDSVGLSCLGLMMELVRSADGSWRLTPPEAKGESFDVSVDFDHFIPHLRTSEEDADFSIEQRVCLMVYRDMFAEPLHALRDLLAGLQYLRPDRIAPASLYRSASSPPRDIGASGEFAAQMLQRRQHDLVHYLPALGVVGETATTPPMVRVRSLVDAVNDVFAELGVDGSLSIEDVQGIGFRLLFGGTSAMHVGRGLTYLLPIVELGLLADPLRFSGGRDDMSLEDYVEQCGDFTHVAMEEPEAHLHPKVQSRLAHWLVSLAMANRRLIVETHSDHLVRRLRGLVARAGRGSELERWLLDNVVILGVEQDAEGRSSVTSSRLTAEGGVGEVWPADFMDEASSEESAIYYASLDKTEPLPASPGELIYVEGEEPEGETEP